MDSYFDFFNTALYTDYVNTLTHSLIEEEGLKEVVRLDLYNKFKMNSSDLDFQAINSMIYLDQFLFIEQLNSFEQFVDVYESKISTIQETLNSFDFFFKESFFNFDVFQEEFFFNNFIKSLVFKDIIFLYNNSLILYDSLAFLYSHDPFFCGLFDVFKTLNVPEFCFFLDKLGDFVFFLEHFLLSLDFFIEASDSFYFPEFFKFISESFFFYSSEFSNLNFGFNKLKEFLDFQGFIHFFGIDNFFSFLNNTDNSFNASTVFENF